MANKTKTVPMTHNGGYKWKWGLWSSLTDSTENYYNYANAPEDSYAPADVDWTGYYCNQWSEDDQDYVYSLVRVDWPKDTIFVPNFVTPRYTRPTSYFTKRFTDGLQSVGKVIVPGSVPGYSQLSYLYNSYVIKYNEKINAEPSFPENLTPFKNCYRSSYDTSCNLWNNYINNSIFRTEDNIKPRGRCIGVVSQEFIPKYREGASKVPSSNNQGYYWYSSYDKSLEITWTESNTLKVRGDSNLCGGTAGYVIYQQDDDKVELAGSDFEDNAIPEYLFVELQGGGGGGAGNLGRHSSSFKAPAGAAGGYASAIIRKYRYTAPADENLGSASYRIILANDTNSGSFINSGRGGLGASEDSYPSAAHINPWVGYQEDGQRGGCIKLQICTGSSGDEDQGYEFTWETLITCYGGEGGHYDPRGFPLVSHGGTVQVHNSNYSSYCTVLQQVAGADSKNQSTTATTSDTIISRGVFTTNGDDAMARGNYRGGSTEASGYLGYPSSASYLCAGTQEISYGNPGGGSALMGAGGAGGKQYSEGTYGLEGGHGGSPVGIVHLMRKNPK